jgi:hypothetical protein
MVRWGMTDTKIPKPHHATPHEPTKMPPRQHEVAHQPIKPAKKAY